MDDLLRRPSSSVVTDTLTRSGFNLQPSSTRTFDWETQSSSSFASNSREERPSSFFSSSVDTARYDASRVLDEAKSTRDARLASIGSRSLLGPDRERSGFGDRSTLMKDTTSPPAASTTTGTSLFSSPDQQTSTSFLSSRSSQSSSFQPSRLSPGSTAGLSTVQERPNSLLSGMSSFRTEAPQSSSLTEGSKYKSPLLEFANNLKKSGSEDAPERRIGSLSESASNTSLASSVRREPMTQPSTRSPFDFTTSSFTTSSLGGGTGLGLGSSYNFSSRAEKPDDIQSMTSSNTGDIFSGSKYAFATSAAPAPQPTTSAPFSLPSLNLGAVGQDFDSKTREMERSDRSLGVFGVTTSPQQSRVSPEPSRISPEPSRISPPPSTANLEEPSRFGFGGVRETRDLDMYRSDAASAEPSPMTSVQPAPAGDSSRDRVESSSSSLKALLARLEAGPDASAGRPRSPEKREEPVQSFVVSSKPAEPKARSLEEPVESVAPTIKKSSWEEEGFFFSSKPAEPKARSLEEPVESVAPTTVKSSWEEEGFFFSSTKPSESAAVIESETKGLLNRLEAEEEQSLSRTKLDLERIEREEQSLLSPSRIQPSTSDLYVGKRVEITSDVACLEREVKACGMAWPSGPSGRQWSWKLGMAGEVQKVDFEDGTVFLSDGVGWTPIKSLVGFHDKSMGEMKCSYLDEQMDKLTTRIEGLPSKEVSPVHTQALKSQLEETHRSISNQMPVRDLPGGAKPLARISEGTREIDSTALSGTLSDPRKEQAQRRSTCSCNPCACFRSRKKPKKRSLTTEDEKVTSEMREIDMDLTVSAKSIRQEDERLASELQAIDKDMAKFQGSKPSGDLGSAPGIDITAFQPQQAPKKRSTCSCNPCACCRSPKKKQSEDDKLARELNEVDKDLAKLGQGDSASASKTRSIDMEDKKLASELHEIDSDLAKLKEGDSVIVPKKSSTCTCNPFACIRACFRSCFRSRTKPERQPIKMEDAKLTSELQEIDSELAKLKEGDSKSVPKKRGTCTCNPCACFCRRKNKQTRSIKEGDGKFASELQEIDNELAKLKAEGDSVTVPKKRSCLLACCCFCCRKKPKMQSLNVGDERKRDLQPVKMEDEKLAGELQEVDKELAKLGQGDRPSVPKKRSCLLACFCFCCRKKSKTPSLNGDERKRELEPIKMEDEKLASELQEVDKELAKLGQGDRPSVPKKRSCLLACFCFCCRKKSKKTRSLVIEDETFTSEVREGTKLEREDLASEATIIQFSGCNNKQTSADVADTSSFGIRGPSAAGGACTCSILKALQRNPKHSWAGLLRDMRRILKEDGYKQIPQLCCNREMDLNEPMTLLSRNPQGRFRSVLVGINYVGQSAQLSGCQNDVLKMQELIRGIGFSKEDQMMLLDDGDHQNPTYENIVRAMSWLVDGAREGDSLFFHYSGHGVRLEDDDGDEADGYDEALAPVDYQEAGMLRDDEIHALMVTPLAAGVNLVCVTDCCHSGTILDLPYRFVANDNTLKNTNTGEKITMPRRAIVL